MKKALLIISINLFYQNSFSIHPIERQINQIRHELARAELAYEHFIDIANITHDTIDRTNPNFYIAMDFIDDIILQKEAEFNIFEERQQNQIEFLTNQLRRELTSRK